MHNVGGEDGLQTLRLARGSVQRNWARAPLMKGSSPLSSTPTRRPLFGTILIESRFRARAAARRVEELLRGDEVLGAEDVSAIKAGA